MSVYLNAASHGLPDASVTRRIITHLELEARIGAPDAAAQVEEEFESVRAKAASLLGADEAHVGFSGATMAAWRLAVAALPMAGKRLLVAPHEWGENIAFLEKLARHAGARVEVLPALDLDAPDLSIWQRAIDEDVAAIFVPMVTSIAGLRYPVAAIGALDRPEGAQVIVDAAQAVGQVAVDAPSLGCDAVFATTRKWVRGPRQTAVFWLADAERVAEIEPFDAHVGLRLGLGVALDIVLSRSVSGIADDLQVRAGLVRKRAAAFGLPGLSSEASGTGAVSLHIPAASAQRVSMALDTAQCIVKWPDASRDEPHSGLDERESKVMRIAPHISNPLRDIDTAFDAIAEAL